MTPNVPSQTSKLSPRATPFGSFPAAIAWITRRLAPRCDPTSTDGGVGWLKGRCEVWRSGQDDVQRVTDDYLEIRSHWWHSSGSSDYKSRSLDVARLVDRHGTVHDCVWRDAPRKLSPGVETRVEGRRRWLRIARTALPVRVLYFEWFEYVVYDNLEQGSSWSRKWWVRYEAGD
jgi:hypothetical protein